MAALEEACAPARNVRHAEKRRLASTDIMAAIRCTDVQFVSFLEGCLRWDHAERFTPEDGLQHEWILEAATPCWRRLGLG